MAQYSSTKTNSRVSITSGSNIVTGIDTEWLGNISVGNGLTVAGTSVIYDIASVDSNTQLTLSSNYAGESVTEAHYTIHRDFTTPDNIPELNNGDIETGTIMKRLARVIQGRFNQLAGLQYAGMWEEDVAYTAGSIIVSENNGDFALYIASENHTSTAANKPPSSEWDVFFDTFDTLTFTSLSWVGEWQPNTEYFEQNVVSYQDSLYVATTNFTSGTTFDANNFDILFDLEALNQIRVDSEAARDKSQLWANEEEDVIVEGTEYSSKHYSIKAEASATSASTSESNASTSETNAESSANLSEDWATLTGSTVDGLEFSSKHYAQESSSSADAAATSASDASTSEINASNSADAASVSETNAATSESNALTSENKAEEWAENPVDVEVEVGKFSALHHADKASDSASAAATSESNAATSESNALTSANNASMSESNAQDSATAAATSESNAATSESNAATSEANALTSENNAATSASTSEDWATLIGATVDGTEFSSKHYSQESASSASAASTSESNAATSETNASNSADAAAISESNALASENKAEQWADASLGTEVEPNKFSARHWAEQLGAIPETAYNWQGDWVAGTYNAGDAVYHVSTSSSYITLVTTTDEPNINGTSDWQLLARAAQFEEADFTDLDDTPSTYTGSAGLFVQVNGTEDGLIFSAASTYSGWTLSVDGVSRGNIDSEESVDFVGGNNTTLSYNATGNVITIDSLDTTYSAGTGITLTGTTFILTDESYTTAEKDKLAGIEPGATADQTASEIKTAYESNTDTNAFTDAEKTKLTGIETGATANSTDAFLLDRTNHTGSQAISTVTNLQTSLDSKLEDAPSDGNQYARQDGLWSEVTAGAEFVVKPVITSPIENETDVSEIVTDNYSTSDNFYGVYENSVWQFASDSAFTTIVAEVVEGAVNSIIPPGGTENQSLYIRMRKGSDGHWSEWSGTVFATITESLFTIDDGSGLDGLTFSDMEAAGNYDSTTDTGYFGEVSSSTLFTGSGISSEIGLTAGTLQHDTEGWLKFYVGENATCNRNPSGEAYIAYIAKKPYRNDVSWDNINAVDAVFGTPVSKSGYNFSCRLLTGAEADPTVDENGVGSEWNDLMYRIHTDVPGDQVGPNWASFTNSDIIVGSGDGRVVWCQETRASDTSRRVLRGTTSLSGFITRASSTSGSDYGFRPLLVLQ